MTTFEEQGRLVAAIEQLLQLEGWKAFQIDLQRRIDTEVAAVAMSGDPNALLRHAGALRTLRDVAGWAENTIRTYRVQMEEHRRRTNGK